MELSEVLYQKCQGNCFWTIQFMLLLKDDEFLYFSSETYHWEWELERIISDTCVTDNVVMFMVEKLKRLPQDTLECLEAASCLGHKFDVAAMESVINATAEEINDMLEVALDEGLVTRRVGTNLYRFAHDRIQQASYLMLELNQERRDAMHWNIGKYLESQMMDTGDEQFWKILVAAEQMNLAADKYCHTEEQKVDLITLNLEAARGARMQHVFVTAAKYIDAALDLIMRDDGTEALFWSKYRDLTLELYELGAHLQVTIGENDRALEMVDAIAERPDNDIEELERARAQCIRLEIWGGQLRHREAIQLTGDIVRNLGMNFPTKPSVYQVAGELVKVKSRLKKFTYEELSKLPETHDKTMHTVMWCLARGILFGYYAQDEEFMGICILKLAKYSMKHGVCVEATLGFQMLGLYLGHIGGFDRCYNLGILAMDLQERFTERRGGLTSAYAYYFNHHIRHPLSDSLEPLLACYETSMEFGDPTGKRNSA